MCIIKFRKNYINLKLPVYFDQIEKPFIRFESFLYNFEFNLEKRSYILYFYFGTKERVKVLFSTFFNFLSLKKHTYAFYIKNLIYLFWNSFSVNSKLNVSEKDYFPSCQYNKSIYLFSDFYYSYKTLRSNWDRVIFDNLYDIDLSISTGFFDNFQFRFFKLVDDFNPFTTFYLNSSENSKFCLSSSYFKWHKYTNSYEIFSDYFLLLFQSFVSIQKKINYISIFESFINRKLDNYFFLSSLFNTKIWNKLFVFIFEKSSYFQIDQIFYYLKNYKIFFKYFYQYFFNVDLNISYINDKQLKLKNSLSLLLSNIFSMNKRIKNSPVKTVRLRQWEHRFYGHNSNNNVVVSKKNSLFYGKFLSFKCKTMFRIFKKKSRYLWLGKTNKTVPLYSKSKKFKFGFHFYKDQWQIKIVLRKFEQFLLNFNSIIFSIYKKDFLQIFFSQNAFNLQFYLRNFIFAFRWFFVNYKDVLKKLVKNYLKQYRKQSYRLGHNFSFK